MVTGVLNPPLHCRPVNVRFQTRSNVIKSVDIIDNSRFKPQIAEERYDSVLLAPMLVGERNNKVFFKEDREYSRMKRVAHHKTRVVDQVEPPDWADTEFGFRIMSPDSPVVVDSPDLDAI